MHTVQPNITQLAFSTVINHHPTFKFAAPEGTKFAWWNGERRCFFLEAHQFQWFYEPIFDPVMYTSKGYLRLGGGGTTIFARIFTFKNKMEGAGRVANSILIQTK